MFLLESQKPPPWLNSEIKWTYVVALVPYLDIKSFGFGEVLKTIRDDIKKLESGMNITTKSGNFYKVKAKNLTFVADILGYHSVFGFNESFSLGKVCEKCTVPKSMFKLVFEEDESQLRLPTGIKKDALAKTNGLKRVCELETNFFDPYKSFTDDLHHDIFQGSLMKVVRVVLNLLIPNTLILIS